MSKRLFRLVLLTLMVLFAAIAVQISVINHCDRETRGLAKPHPAAHRMANLFNSNDDPSTPEAKSGEASVPISAYQADASDFDDLIDRPSTSSRHGGPVSGDAFAFVPQLFLR